MFCGNGFNKKSKIVNKNTTRNTYIYLIRVVLVEYIRYIILFLRSFFPFQLIFGHLKYNLFALSFWFFLFLIITDKLGYNYGIPFLFYSPEYNGETNWIAFGLIGFALGGFNVAFNTYSYMKMGNKFPFLATLSRPFLRFSLNNSILPIVFNVFFIKRFIEFQRTEEFSDNLEVYQYVFSYVGGYFLFILISLIYFFPVNRDVNKLLGLQKEDYFLEAKKSFFHKDDSFNDFFRYKKNRTYIYMSSLLIWRRSRSIDHYDKELLKKVFARTKINSSLFEIVTVLAFIFLGVFRDVTTLSIPAAMSLVMLVTIILMIFSALRSWFYYWTSAVFISLILFMNYMSTNTKWFQYTSYAYGLSYNDDKKVPFNIETVTERNLSEKQVNNSKIEYVKLLSQWRKNTGFNKPKLMIINTSGGGARSAFWTFAVMQKLDKKTNGALMKNTHLITGASGGMIGASYYRSIVLDDKLKGRNTRFQDSYQRNISKDLLNKLIFAAFSNDMFYRTHFKYNGIEYRKDRGYAFEQQIHSNTNHLMDVRLGYFEKPEKKAVIPSMIFTPTIIDNGRRLLISTHNLAYLCTHPNRPGGLTTSYENVDYQSFFEGNNKNNLRFSSILRMNATFPFVLPMTTMPTTPAMHIMDAGLRDNYGGKITLEMLNKMSFWIRKNTSGVIILQIRDTKKMLRGDIVRNVSLIDKFTLPFGNMYGNFPKTQDFDQEEMMRIAVTRLGFKVNFVTFNLLEEQKKRISLSWHLTSQEKARVNKAFYSRGNKFALFELNRLLKEQR
jgi:hypothetical protein